MFIISEVFFGKGKKTVFDVILEVLANTTRQIVKDLNIGRIFIICIWCDCLSLFVWPHHVIYGILVPQAGLNPCPLHWEYRVLISGPPGSP